MVELSEDDPVFKDPELNKLTSYKVDGVSIIINKTDDINILRNSKKIHFLQYSKEV